MITHIQYIGWPDHGIPENFDSYVQLYEIYRKFRSQCSNAGPICIHCSAGIGRSGTFVGIDALLDHMFNMQNNQEIDKTLNIMKIVYEMRLQRAGMVQTKGQYIFLYQFIDHCLRSGLFEIQLLQK